MQQMTTLIENLWVFLIIIIIGYFLGAKKFVKPEFKNDLTFVLLKVTLPLMVVDAVVQPYKEDLFKKGLMTFVLTSVGFFVCFLIGFLFMKVFKVESRKQGIWLLGSTFSNLGYMGFPVINALYGADGLFLATFANIAYNLFFFSVGVLFVSVDKQNVKFNWKAVFLNNVMIGLYFALILFFAQIPLPGFAEGTVSMLGDMTGPLSMLIIGLTLSEYPLKELFNNRTQYQMSFVRLIAAPLAVVLLLKLFPSDGNEMMIAVLAILLAMPIAGNTTLLATEYGGDEEFAAKSTILSSILCIATTPLIFLLV